MVSGAPPRETAIDPEIMASIDEQGISPRLVIADITVEEAWLSIVTSAAVTLSDWR